MRRLVLAAVVVASLMGLGTWAVAGAAGPARAVGNTGDYAFTATAS